MKIFLMRHGEASWESQSDLTRELNENGKFKVDLNISQRKQDLEGITQFITSPYLRAKQTAEIAAKILGYKNDMMEVEWLSPDYDVRDAIDELQKLPYDSVMLFSHQPFSSAFIEILCGIDRGYITMSTASIAAMEADVVAAGLGNLIWQH